MTKIFADNMLSGLDDKEDNAEKASLWDNVGFTYVLAVNDVFT